MSPDHKISLALTHYNRFSFLLECVAQVLGDDRIGEIVISDDASTDGSFEQLKSHFASNPKVKLFRNEVNLDCYANKAKAVELTTNGWLILFDSDNVLPRAYVDTLYALPTWDVNTAYLPDFAEPHFDYTVFGGAVINRSNVSQMMGTEVKQFIFDHRPKSWQARRLAARVARTPRRMLAPVHQRFRTALNTCNYFVHRDEYLAVWDGTVNPHTADTIYQNFNWLNAGKRLAIVKGLRYFHRVHAESHFKLNNKKTGLFAWEVETKLKGLR